MKVDTRNLDLKFVNPVHFWLRSDEVKTTSHKDVISFCEYLDGNSRNFITENKYLKLKF